MKRFFLVEKAPVELGNLDSTYMEVSYLCMNPMVVMIQKGNEFYLGEVKNNSLELGIEDLKHIEPNVYAALSTVVKATAVKLVIYELTLNNGTKVFLNKYEDDKMIASVDFLSVEDATMFEIPDWFGKELQTQDDYVKAGFVLKNKFFKK